jgi:hypothetical protein
MTHRRWTDSNDDLLIKLAGQTDPRLSWDAIGERFGVTGQAAFNRHKKVAGLRGLPPKQGIATRWTNAQDIELLRRGDAGEPFDLVGADLGRSRHACKNRYNILKGKAARPVTVTVAVRPSRGAETSRLNEADRLRVQALVHDSLTAWFCGDPLPGRSALDEKMQAGATASRRHVTLAGRPM